MATTLINGVKSPGGQKQYTLTAEVTSRTASQFTLYFTLTLKYVTAKTNSKSQEIEIFMPAVYGSMQVSKYFKLGKSEYKAGTVRTFTWSETLSATSQSGYYFKIPKIVIEYWNGDTLSDNGSLTLSNLTSSIYIPAVASPIDPTPTPTPTPVPTPVTYNITASATAGLNTATITLKGLPSSTCNIAWYLNGVIKKNTTKTSGTTVSETFTGLVPSTSYTLRGVVTSGGSTVGAASATTATSGETGDLSLTASSRSITATLSGMSAAPSYSRAVTFKIFSEATGYTKEYSMYGVNATSAVYAFENLNINTTYSVTATIKNGGKTLKTISVSKTTSDDYSSVPTAQIIDVKQRQHTKEEASVTWITDKKAAQTKYYFEILRGSSWELIKTLTSADSPTTISFEFPTGAIGADYTLRIRAENTNLSDRDTISEEKTFHIVGDYDFDNPKAKGQPINITANEWNRLADMVDAKGVSYDLSFDIKRVSVGDSITAELYNEMKNAISKMYGINITDKQSGNPIKASDINALRTGINRA